MKYVLAALLFLPATASAHGASKSYADWTVEGDRAALRLSFAAHDLTAAVPGLDADADNRLVAEELSAQRETLGSRVIQHTSVRAGRVSADEDCVPDDPIVRGIGEPAEEVQVTVVYTCPSSIGALVLRSNYLPELEPPHATLATVTGGEESAQHVFAPQAPELVVTFDLPPLSKVLFEALLAGLKANLAPAPLLFCLALVLSRRGRAFGGILAAFIVTHAVLLFIGGPQFPFLPLVVAIAVAWVGLETLVSPDKPASSPPHAMLAGIFGALFGVLAHVRVPRELVPKLAFVIGATAPLLLAFLVGHTILVVAGDRQETVVRGIGIGVLGSALVLVVLHFL